MKRHNKNRQSSPFPGWMSKEATRPCFRFFVFILCVLVSLGYCYFMLSVPVQLIAWKDRPRNDLLYVKRDVKKLLTQSLLARCHPTNGVAALKESSSPTFTYFLCLPMLVGNVS